MLPIFFSLSNVKFNYILGFSDIFRHNNADFEYCNIIWTQISPEFTSIQVSQFQRPFFARVRWHLLFRFPMQSFNIRPNFDPNCRQVHEHANKVLFPIPFPFQPPCLHLLSKFPMQGLLSKFPMQGLCRNFPCRISLSKFPMQGGEHSNQILAPIPPGSRPYNFLQQGSQVRQLTRGYLLLSGEVA